MLTSAPTWQKATAWFAFQRLVACYVADDESRGYDHIIIQLFRIFLDIHHLLILSAESHQWQFAFKVKKHTLRTSGHQLTAVGPVPISVFRININRYDTTEEDDDDDDDYMTSWWFVELENLGTAPDRKSIKHDW